MFLVILTPKTHPSKITCAGLKNSEIITYLETGRRCEKATVIFHTVLLIKISE